MREKNICTVCLALKERAPRRALLEALLLLVDLEPHRPEVLACGLFQERAQRLAKRVGGDTNIQGEFEFGEGPTLKPS